MRCILSKFYIKPQQCAAGIHFFIVVSYRNSTSNHNPSAPYIVGTSLYLIEILHQTTTSACSEFVIGVLYLIEILHQTTTVGRDGIAVLGCILSKFYIKPQPAVANIASANVVSYRNSTSNHNHDRNVYVDVQLYLIEILHQTTTLPYDGILRDGLYLIEILHQTTTWMPTQTKVWALYLIEILHQTTTN